jgi:hypothetical protein
MVIENPQGFRGWNCLNPTPPEDEADPTFDMLQDEGQCQNFN